MNAIEWMAEYLNDPNLLMTSRYSKTFIEVKGRLGPFTDYFRLFMSHYRGGEVVLFSAQSSMREYQEQFEVIPFLGRNRLFLVLFEQDGLFKPLPQAVLHLCEQYKGAIPLYCFAAAPEKIAVSANWRYIKFPAVVDERLFEMYARMVHSGGQVAQPSRELFAALSQYTKQLSWQEAALVIPYVSLLGRSIKEFCQSWMPQLLEQQNVLFLLKQYLLGRNKQKFYALWILLQSNYPDEFWLVFWSETFWQAYRYITLKNCSVGEPERVLIRSLPFSFVRSDWRLHKIESLAQALRTVFLLDQGMKTVGCPVRYEPLFNALLV